MQLLERPDLQINIFEWSTLERNGTRVKPHPFPGFTLMPVHLRPDGRGTVRLKSSDPLAPPAPTMTTPALMTAGDRDQSPLSVRGPDWWTDAYRQSPGEKSLLTLFGAEHSQGGVHAYGGMSLTPSESPALVALVQNITTAYLRRALHSDDAAWTQAVAALHNDSSPLGRLESK